MKWKSKDGLEVEGLLVKPVGFKEGQRYPTLVYVHGGPSSQFVGFALYPSTTPQAARYPLQVFAGQGYAIFCPNPRGSGSYGVNVDQRRIALSLLETHRLHKHKNRCVQDYTRLERFRAKWIPVRVKKTRQNKNLELRF